jgi:hypothetical protein
MTVFCCFHYEISCYICKVDILHRMKKEKDISPDQEDT